MANEFVIRKGLRILSVDSVSQSRMLMRDASNNVVYRNISDMQGASGYSGKSGYSGTSGNSGYSGVEGASGSHSSNSLRWMYGTNDPPNSTYFNLDNSAFASVSRINIHETCLDSSAVAWLTEAYNSASGTSGSLILKIFVEKGTQGTGDDGKHGIYLISSVGYSSGVYTFNVSSVISSSGSVAVKDVCVISFVTHGQSGASGAKPTMDYYSNINWFANSTTVGVMSNTSACAPFTLPAKISMDYVRLLASQINGANTTLASSTSNYAGSCIVQSTLYAVIYSREIGAAHEFRSVASGSAQIAYNVYAYCLVANSTASMNYIVSYPITGGTSSYSIGYTTNKTVAGVPFYTSVFSNFSGTRFFDIPLAATLPEGDYWMMIGRVSTLLTTNAWATALSSVRMSANYYGISQTNISPSMMGSNTVGSVQLMLGLGSLTTNSTGTSASISVSKVSRSSNNNMMFFQLLSNKSAT